MTRLGVCVLALSTGNVALFCLAARVAFDGRVAGSASKVFLGAFLALFGLTAFHLYWFLTFNPLRLAAACGLLVASLSVFGCAWLAILQRPLTVVLSPDLPEHMLTHGIYAYIRHPFYTSYIATFVAMAVACEHSVGISCALAIAALYVAAAAYEEHKFSRSHFARAYAAYKQQAGMFLPRLGARPATGAPGDA